MGEQHTVDECKASVPFTTNTHNLLRGAFGLQICFIVVTDVEEASSCFRCFRRFSFNVEDIRFVIQTLFEVALFENFVLLVPLIM